MDQNGPKHSSKIDCTNGLAQVAISWPNAKTVGPQPTYPHLSGNTGILSLSEPEKVEFLDIFILMSI